MTTKASNFTFLRPADVQRGRVSPRRSSSALAIVSNEIAEFDDIAEFVFPGAAVEEVEEGVARITWGGGALSEGSNAGTSTVPILMLNNSGIDLIPGDAVITDSTADEAVTVTSIGSNTQIAGIVQAPIAAGSNRGPVLFNGYAAEVTTTGTVTRGHYLYTSGTQAAAVGAASRGAGAFGVILKAPEVTDFVESSATTTDDDAVTSLAITMPEGLEAGRQLFLALYRDPAVTTAVTLTGWTRVGSTSGFWYYRRLSTGDDTATATWTTATPAVAIVLLLRDGVNLATPIQDFSYEATSAAAVVSGLDSNFHRFAIAAVQAAADTPANWTLLGSASALATGGSGTSDLNPAATVSHDTAAGRHTGDAARLWNYPTRSNDNNDTTFAFINGGITNYGCYMKSDLGAAASVSAFRLYMISTDPTELDHIQYSTDGTTWNTIAFTETGSRTNPTGATLTFDAGPITARYWAVHAAHTGGSGGPGVYRWEILGTADQAAHGTIVGQYIGTAASVTSPFSGAGLATDAVFVFNLTFIPKASALLYGPDLGGGAGLEPTADAHIADTSDAHDASAVSLLDSAGLFTATDVEAAIAELATKDIGYQAHGNMGATETFSALTGWHSGTFDASCTFTFSGATSGIVASMVLELLENGTGGFSPTWPGSVVWPGGTPTHTTTAGTTTLYLFQSRDGGTTWYGFQAGSGATSPLTTKGDLWGYDTADARVPVGTNGYLLVADSTDAQGIVWENPETTGHWEVLMTGASPAEPLEDGSGADWLYTWVP